MVSKTMPFFQLRQSKTPGYLFNEIPPERQIPYMIRNRRNYDPNFCRTDRFSNSYFINTIYEFNLLNSEIRNSKSISEFKRKLLSVIRPTKKPVFVNSTVTVTRYLTQLRMRFSPLNAHRLRHNFDCLSPLCVCGAGDEDNEHFFLHCHLFQAMRSELFGQLSEVPGFKISNLLAKEICELILYGSSELKLLANRLLMEATLHFIKNTKKFF